MKSFLAAALPGAYSSVRYHGEGSSRSIVLPPHDYALEVPRAISCLNSEWPYLTPANAQTGLPVALWACHACFLLSFSHCGHHWAEAEALAVLETHWTLPSCRDWGWCLFAQRKPS